WRGSVYKLVWRELLAYLFIYYTVNLIYRFALNEHQQRIFERIRLYFSQQSETIPMSFVLGFYVSLVVKRWWEQYKLLPWPDTLALFLNAGIPGASVIDSLLFSVVWFVFNLRLDSGTGAKAEEESLIPIEQDKEDECGVKKNKFGHTMASM
ncbi:hypothetical protein NQ317_019912, partial [Molorchus minor]